MKRWLILILILLSIAVLGQSFFGYSRAVVIYPVGDAPETDLPRQLRTVLPIQEQLSHLNLQGLQHLRISGSGQFSETAFTGLIHRLDISPDKLVILDLREESHGFIDGKSVSWTNGTYNHANLHKTSSEIESDEYLRLRLAAQAKLVVLDPLKEATRLTVRTVKTEREVVEGRGSLYVRLPVTDYCYPNHEVIDQFVELVKDLHPDQWVHMHCRAGRGRTTTFLVLFDVMRNAQDVSLEDILARQAAMGGSDLSRIERKDDRKSQAAKERLELIEKFYLYCKQVPDFQMSWSEWIKSQARHTEIRLNSR